MSEIVGLILPVFGLVFLGFGVGRLRRVPTEGLAALHFFLFYLAVPALFFQIIARTPTADLAGWSFVLTTTFSTYCAFAIAFSIGALINGGNVSEATVQGLIGSHANIGYIAPALAIAAFGTAAAVPAALIFSFDNVMLATLTPLMMALGGTARADPTVLAESILRQALLHPFVIATLAGVLAASIGFEPPAVIETLLSLLGNAAAPAALFALGIGLAQHQIGKVTVETPVLIGVKLIVHPLIVYLLLSWVGGFERLWLYAAVLMAALPPAAEVIVAAQRYGTYAGRASSAVLLGTLVSIATVTIVVILLLNDVLPVDPFR